jgi:glutathionyl-hydroquinone reductase
MLDKNIKNEHTKIHRLWNTLFNRLLSDFIAHTDGSLESKIEQLMSWSYEQSREPDHDA